MNLGAGISATIYHEPVTTEYFYTEAKGETSNPPNTKIYWV